MVLLQIIRSRFGSLEKTRPSLKCMPPFRCEQPQSDTMPCVVGQLSCDGGQLIEGYCEGKQWLMDLTLKMIRTPATTA